LLLEMQLHFCVCRLQKKNVPLSVTRLWQNLCWWGFESNKRKNLQFTNVVGFLTQLRWMMM
jgi:hypothetical protein